MKRLIARSPEGAIRDADGLGVLKNGDRCTWAGDPSGEEFWFTIGLPKGLTPVDVGARTRNLGRRLAKRGAEEVEEMAIRVLESDMSKPCPTIARHKCQ